MRFYVPEWDDAVDGDYDFKHDELSTLDRDERDLQYIWDIFEEDTTPIDGVLVSREKVEESRSKTARLREHGVYDDPVLSIPDYLPTISDCGAWGYKWLPFPPYGNQGMLDFYEDLDVSVGVTIDHLVLGSGKERGRLYLDERAFGEGFDADDLPDDLSEVVELKIEEWPDEWPPYVAEYEPSICTGESGVDPFDPDLFRDDPEAVLERLDDDHRAVYRTDDKEFRYELTLRNAREMLELYQAEDYPFRLMAAVQGWTADRYVSATRDVLEMGYDYVGIGGIAGSPIHEVRKAVKEVGKVVKEHERATDTRVDTHIFGFAKAEAFETIGRSGMASFDSASMLRSAWTGAGNYRLADDHRYDAIRVRYPPHGADVETAVEWALRGRETLVTLRAYAADESIPDALQTWHSTAERTIDELESYLRTHRHDADYDASRLQDIEMHFRDDFALAGELNASFSGDFRRRLAKLLRSDGPDDPTDFATYEEVLLAPAREALDRFPRSATLFDPDRGSPITDAHDLVRYVVLDYARWVGDEDLIEEYERTLADRPWEQCDCPICAEIGVEVAIFRGNDRNRRRGFHNTRRFYDEFDEALPKTLILTQATAALTRSDTVQEYLRDQHPAFWNAVHDLPVAEVGTFDANGIYEWHEPTPDAVSFAPQKLSTSIRAATTRYDRVFVHAPDEPVDDAVERGLADAGCALHPYSDATALRDRVLDSLGENYAIGRDFVPHPPEVPADDDLDVLVVDQCSGSKEVPEQANEFTEEELRGHSKAELLDRPNVPGIAARDLYTGRQQEFVDEAVRILQSEGVDVDRYYVSAGFGVVAEDEPLPPYEVTFSGMTADEVRDRSARLGIREDIERLLTDHDYDIVFLTLGKDYYRSIDVDEAVRNVTPDRIAVVFNRDLVDQQYDNVVSVPARTDDAKRHGTIVIGLKGLYMKNFATNLSDVESLDPDTISDLCRYVETTQTALTD